MENNNPECRANQAIQFMAQSMGELHGMFLTELLRELEELGGNERLLARSLLTRLNADGFATEEESKLLDQMVEALANDTDLASAKEQVDRCYRSIVACEHPSPIAVAIAGVARSSIALQSENEGIVVLRKEKEEKDKDKKGTGFADLMGALAGGNIGSKGGLLGGIIGVVAGGLGASYLASRDEKKKSDKKE